MILPCLVEKKKRVATAPARFADKYGSSELRIYHGTLRRRLPVSDIVAELREIERGGNVDEAAVVAAIGNDSWTRCECDICTKDAEKLIRFGEGGQCVCEECMEAALEMLYKHDQQKKENGI